MKLLKAPIPKWYSYPLPDPGLYRIEQTEEAHALHIGLREAVTQLCTLKAPLEGVGGERHE